MYSLIRTWIGLKLARIEIHVRVVVRTTRARDSPSTPSLYSIPNSGIQLASSLNWKPEKPAWKPAARTSETAQVRRAVARARLRAHRVGAKAMTIAPASGTNVTRSEE